MRIRMLRIVLFLLMVFTLYIININVFRSEMPNLVIITLLGSVIGLLYFPYKSFFNIKEL